MVYYDYYNQLKVVTKMLKNYEELWTEFKQWIVDYRDMHGIPGGPHGNVPGDVRTLRNILILQ